MTPDPRKPSEGVDWHRVLIRFGGLWARVESYPDDHESPALSRLCELRDGLLGAARSGDVAKIKAAMRACDVQPPAYPSGLDAQTVEACAKVADKAKNIANERYLASPPGIEKIKASFRYETASDLSSAIRALLETKEER